jgi:hypothetical protein
MTSSLTLPGSGFYYPKRKHSLHDLLDWDRSDSIPQSDAVQRILDSVKRTGKSQDQCYYPLLLLLRPLLRPRQRVNAQLRALNTAGRLFLLAGVDVEDIDSIENTPKNKVLTNQEEYQETLVFNNAIREIFLNRFVQLFSSYEHFIIQPSQVNIKPRTEIRRLAPNLSLIIRITMIMPRF